jgi:hypothetical protein
MPAAELSRLRKQINGLIERFDDPLSFRLALRDLLDMYANRAYRPGQAVQPQPLLPSYRVPPLITHQLQMELSKTCLEQPILALEIIETIWHDPYLEPRLLAAALLGAIPVSLGMAVVQKLRAWTVPAENFRMLDALFTHATINLRREAPHLLFTLYEEWINSPQISTQSLGVRALIPVIEDEDFENLPQVFRLLSPLVQNPPAALQTDLRTALQALARRTPVETTYFLRQALSVAPGPNTALLVRRCLPFFEPPQQASLRAALKAASRD